MNEPLTLEGADGNLVVVGLDCETSGSELSSGHRLIQAGLAAHDGASVEIFSSLVGWPADSWSGNEWSLEAEAVHRISRERLADAPPAEIVDADAAAWLLARGGRSHFRRILTVGFNVGAFDHPFFARYLPRTRGLITHRHIDLNSVCFTLHGRPHNGRSHTWQEWKEAAKQAAAAQLSHVGGAHDAGYDAAEALLAWVWLREQINNG